MHADLWGRPLVAAWSPPITTESTAMTPQVLGASGPRLPYICRTILYQTCKP